MSEYDFCWPKGRSYVEATVPSGSAWKTKLMRYAKTHPNEVKVIAVNEDGSALFHVPTNWFKCSPPRKVSDEQKEAAAERFRQMWEDRRIEESNNE